MIDILDNSKKKGLPILILEIKVLRLDIKKIDIAMIGIYV